jgi:hypothetical protein
VHVHPRDRSSFDLIVSTHWSFYLVIQVAFLVLCMYIKLTLYRTFVELIICITIALVFPPVPSRR